MDYLFGRGQHAGRDLAQMPVMVLLDLKLPMIPGFEVLEWIRRSPEHRALPVVIFSSSSHPDDPVKARSLGANDYWQKPSNGLRYTEIVSRIQGQISTFDICQTASVPTKVRGAANVKWLLVDRDLI